MKNSAFSIIELVGVIAIIAIISTASAPAFKSVSRYLSLKLEGEKIISTLRKAQQNAVSKQNNFAVKFYEFENAYSLIEFSASETDPSYIVEVELEKNNIAGSVEIAEISGFLNNQAEFSPFGAALAAGGVKLRDANGNKFEIEVSPAGLIKKK